MIDWERRENNAPYPCRRPDAISTRSCGKSQGLDSRGYLQSLVEQEGNGNLPAFSIAEFERELDELATDGPTLPRDFSRADIHAEHD